MKVITRFAPSPTGYLHIGGARTALFNYLFARHYKGKFLLRIEDTDFERSTEQATNAIFDGLKWLSLNWDGEVIFQSKRQIRHQEVAHELIGNGKAYYCFTPQAEIDQLREEAIAKKEHFIFQSKWRDADPLTYPEEINPVVRLKAPRNGQTIIHDHLQGDVVVENDHLDDMVLLRSDGTPTYMLAVVVDDHDMNITHIIRGDDHLSNAARQILIYQALEWEVPTMVHIPLIHGADGAKLSKRHGALGVDAYKEMGYLPEAMCNYLLRLGWSHGDDEIIGREQAIEWFDLRGLGKSPARLDFAKMKFLNAHYLRDMDNEIMAKIIIETLEQKYILTPISKDYIKQGIEAIKPRVELLTEAVNLAKIYIVNHPLEITSEAKEIIKNVDKELISEVIDALMTLKVKDKNFIQNLFKEIALNNNIKIGELMAPVRALITGMTASPSVFEVISIIGKDYAVERLKEAFNDKKLS